MPCRFLSSWSRFAAALLSAATATLAAPAHAAATGLPGADPGPPVRVIVEHDETRGAQAQEQVRRLGGTVTQALPIVSGFAATVPATAVAALRSAPAVQAVTPDAPVHVQASAGGASAAAAPQDSAALVRTLRADRVWATGNRGQGVTVALLDTGVSSVPDLSGRLVSVRDDETGQVMPCQNLSGEPDCVDRYGHGTFIAGIIAGNGSASKGKWSGVAPAAKVLSVKVAGQDGSTDVSNVLAAIQWVVSFKDRYGIRVLNLSLGTDSTAGYRTSPLNYAVERAWDAGIAVVVAASNLGPASGTVSKPGDDPLVVTVGATDDRGTAGIADDELPDFSSRGPTVDGLAKPDVVAPGAHVVSLRSVGSTIDTRYPTYIDGSYRRGSGTSFSTGAVSGVAALMVAADPGLVPDRLKHRLLLTARPAASSDLMAAGAGEVDAYAAVTSKATGQANTGIARSNGSGLLEASRGHVHVQTRTDDVLVNGVLTAQLVAWDATGYLAPWTQSRWYVSTWRLTPFLPVRWAGGTWPGREWGGSTWYGEPMSRSYGSPLPGSAWYGAWG